MNTKKSIGKKAGVLVLILGLILSVLSGACPALSVLDRKKKKEETPKHLAVLRPLNHEESGNIQIILMAVVAAIVIAISIVIVYSVLGGIDYTSIDAKLDGTPCQNASNSLQTNLATFYSVSPIYIVVLAAVGIISAIMMVVISRKK